MEATQRSVLKASVLPAKAHAKKKTSEEMDKHIKNLKARDSEVVTGIFKFLENRGGTLDFRYRAYAGDEFEHYSLTDGHRYQIPRGVARHLNNNCFYKEYKHLPGEFGDGGIRGASPDGKFRNVPDMQVAQKVHRTAFQSLEFMDDDIEMNQVSLAEVSMQ